MGIQDARIQKEMCTRQDVTNSSQCAGQMRTRASWTPDFTRKCAQDKVRRQVTVQAGCMRGRPGRPRDGLVHQKYAYETVCALIASTT